MRALAVFVVIAMFGCNREPSLDVIDAPAGWTRIEDTAEDQALAMALGFEYRERKTLTIERYQGPSGARLRVIRVRASDRVPTLLRRLARHRGPGVYRLDTVGQLAIDAIDTADAHHVGLEVQPEPSDDPDAVVRSSILLASCIAAPDAAGPRPTDTEDPCIRALATGIDEAKDDADGSWMYWYIVGLVFASLVIGRSLQLGRRLLPPKSSSGLPQARVTRR